MRSVLKGGLLTTVFLLPLIGAVNGFGYELSKVIFFIFSVTTLGFLWIVASKNNLNIKRSSISKAALVFLLVLLITSLTGIDLKSSLLGNQPYFQGLILYSYLCLFYLLTKTHEIKLKYWARILTLSSFLVSLLAIKDYIYISFDRVLPTYAGRVVATFGQPNFYSGFILLTLPFLYFLVKEKYLSWILALGVALVDLFAIWISGSKTAIFMSLGLIVFWLLKSVKFNKVILVECLIFAFIFSIGIVEREITKPISTNNPDLITAGVEKRVYIWPVARELILQKPLTGYGLENIAPVFSGYFEKNKHALFEENLKVQPYMFGLKDLNLDRSHNYILDLLLFSGILGLLGWLGLVIMLFKKLIHLSYGRSINVLVVSLITYLVWIQFQNQSVVHLLYFWLIAGMIDQKV